MFIKSFLRQIFENGFFAQKKQEDKRLFFLFHSFPSSSFHQVTQSPCQMNTIPNQATIPPRFLLLYFLSFHPCHIFNCSAFCSFPSSNPFSFTRLLVTSSQQGTKLESSGRRAICHSVACLRHFTSTIVLSFFDFYAYFTQSRLFSFCLVFSLFFFY